MTRTSSILITLLLFVTGSSCAQTGTIKGRVIELEDYSLDKMGSINISMLHSRHGVTVNHPGDMSYVIRELPPGPDTVRVYTVGYDFQYVPVTVYPDSELVVNVEVTGGNGWTELDCSSRPSPPITRPGRGTITGTVTDVSTGKALSEAFIDVREDVLDTSGNGRSCSLFASETDSAGRYVVHDVAPVATHCTGEARSTRSR